MTVIAFTVARFTPADLREWDSVAQPKLDKGLWGSVTRCTRRDHDELVVRFPNLDRPVFRFERDHWGVYRLLFNDRKGWYEIGQGETAAACLAVWRGTPHRADAAVRPPPLPLSAAAETGDIA